MTRIERTHTSNGGLSLAADGAAFVYHRPRPGVVLVVATGRDRGQFGHASLDEMREDLSRFAPCEIFVDATRARGVQMPVQEMWTDWFAEHRTALKCVSVLAGGKYMQVTVEIAKLFSRTGELIRVYLDEDAFEATLERAAPGAADLRRG